MLIIATTGVMLVSYWFYRIIKNKHWLTFCILVAVNAYFVYRCIVELTSSNAWGSMFILPGIACLMFVSSAIILTGDKAIRSIMELALNKRKNKDAL